MGIYFSICSLVFLVIIMFIFLNKTIMYNKETIIYRKLLYITLLGLFLEIFTGVMYVATNDLTKPYYILLSRLTVTYYAVWTLYFNNYLLNICNYKKGNNILYNMLAIAVIIFSLILPFSFSSLNGQVVPGGASLYFVYFVIVIFTILNIGIAIKDRKKIPPIKMIPLYSLLGLGLLGILCSVFFPGTLIFGFILSLIDFIMYFTIENPDVKMLEEFKLAKDRAEKANEEKELFLYNMTQDVRLPLYDIRKASDWLSDNVKEIHEKDIKDGMYYINSKASNVLEKVNNILDITNMEITNIKVYNTKYDIRLLLEELSKSYKNKINKNVKLKFNIDSNMPDYLDGDMLRLKQLITIILDNACEHTEKGFIEVNLNTVVKRGICRLILSIEDTGCGIKASDIDEIFNKEKQMNASLDKVDDNKKNLAIAKSIATLLGGILMLESEIGAGTKVTLVLDQKIYEEKSETLEKLEGDSKKYIALPKVMVVSEDNEYLNEIVKKLSKYEIEIEALDLGEKCLNKIRLRHKYDLIIMDEELKKLNALEILKKLKEINGFDIPVAILTNNTDNLGFVKAGFNYILNRKITKKELDELINGIE